MHNKSHFPEGGVVAHLREAREKGRSASRESHGLEASDHLMGGADAAKESALAILLLLIIGNALSLTRDALLGWMGLFFLGFFIWKVGRSACLAWARLERINRLIEDEKREIRENREEEKSELTEMYRAKGFSGKLLEEVITVLMADENKLLGIMLEEELGVSLESYDHPLKIALGVAIGLLLAAAAFISSALLSSALSQGLLPLFITCYLIIALSSYVMASLDRIEKLHTLVWNLAITTLAGGATYFFARFLIDKGLIG